MSRRGVLSLAAVLMAGALAILVPWYLNRGGGLEWAAAPQVYRVPGLATDRIVAGEVQNTSNHDIYADARTARVVDATGRRLQTGARFLSTFAHALYSPMQFDTFGDAFQLQRLGIVVRIAPGQRMPFTVSWRAGPGDAAATRIDLGAGSLSIPTA